MEHGHVLMRNILGNQAHQIGWKQNGSMGIQSAQIDRDLAQKDTGNQMSISILRGAILF